MAKSPGHEKYPGHKINQHHPKQRLAAELDGEIIADSADVIRVEEDGYPARYYFPRADVRAQKLKRSEKTTECPFKGTAHYFNVNAAGQELLDAAWSYESPYEEHSDLKDRIAFSNDQFTEIEVRPVLKFTH